MKKLLVIQVAGWGAEFNRRVGCAVVAGREVGQVMPVFPALTSPVQATIRTALKPEGHGVVTNGFFDTRLRRAFFWEQSSGLVSGERVWSGYRQAGGRVGVFFFQQSLGDEVDAWISPAPIHKHSGGHIMACNSQPEGLQERLEREVGRKFSLSRYWGPLASVRSSEWIAESMAALMRSGEAPGVIFAYLPGLDYDLQRYGPEDGRSRAAMQSAGRQLELLFRVGQEQGYEVVAYGDYAITSARGGAVYPNRVLCEAGLLRVRMVRGMAYADLHASRAFAMVDHQVASVWCRDEGAREQVVELLGGMRGVGQVAGRGEQVELGVGHERAGEVLLVAEEGVWFAYPWWKERGEAPDYASHVDIHSKPGFDPCELFFGRTPFSVTQDSGRVGGTHGLSGSGYEAALVSTLPELGGSATHVELAEGIRGYLS